MFQIMFCMLKVMYSKIWGNIFQMQKLLIPAKLILLHHKFYLYLRRKNIIYDKVAKFEKYHPKMRIKQNAVQKSIPKIKI